MISKGTDAARPGIVEVLPPGLFVLTTTALAGFSIASGGDSGQAWAQLQGSLKNMTSDWVLAICLHIFAYLIGCAARAIKVNTADHLCGRMFG